MVGAQWSLEEERCFWQRVVPISPSRAGLDAVPTRHDTNWKELVPFMESCMGEGARRKYTAQMLYEHWYQNYQRNYSPNAYPFVRRYLISIGEDPDASRPRQSLHFSRRGTARRSLARGVDRGKRPGRPCVQDGYEPDRTSSPANAVDTGVSSKHNNHAAAAISSGPVFREPNTIIYQNQRAPIAAMTLDPICSRPPHYAAVDSDSGDVAFGSNHEIYEAAVHLAEMANSGRARPALVTNPGAGLARDGGDEKGAC